MEASGLRVEGRRTLSRSAATAVLLLMTLFFTTGTTVTTQRDAHAVIPAVLPLFAPALPLSVVSAGVGGGISVVTTGAALAGAGITAGAVIAGNWAVSALFNWSPDAPATFGDRTASTTSVTWTWNGYEFTTSTRPAKSGLVGKHDVGLKVAGTANPGTSCVIQGRTSAGTWTTDVSTACWQGLAQYANETTNGHWWLDRDLSTFDRMRGYQDGAATLFYEFDKDGTAGTTDSGTESLTARPQRSCSDGSTVYGAAQTFTRSAGSDVPLAFPPCPSGTTGTGMAAPITRDADGVLVGDALTGETDTSTAWKPPAVPVAYPDCATYACVMTLVVTAPDGSTFTCTAAGQCVSYADVVKQYPATGEGTSTVARQGPDGNSYQCKFGPYAVAVAECQVIPGAGLGTPADTSTDDPGGCMGGVSWNPISWVYTPIKCAFVPRSSKLEPKVTALRTSWEGTAPGVAVNLVEDTFAQVGAVGTGTTAGGCAGPAVTIPPLHLTDWHPISACAEPMATVARIVKVIATLALLIGVVMVSARVLASSLGLELPWAARGADGD